MALFKDASGQLVVAAALPPGGSVVAPAASGNLVDTTPWLRALDAPGDSAWSPAGYYAAGAEDARGFAGLEAGIDAAALTANWPSVTGTGKPENNATVGASWTTNLTGRPADSELLNSQQQWAVISGTGKPADNATKNTLYRQSTAPLGGMTVNDIWIDTTTLNPKMYTYSGSAWVLSGDVTANNTAAGIAGQGALATLGSVSTDNVDANAITTIESSFVPTFVFTGINSGLNVVNTYANVISLSLPHSGACKRWVCLSFSFVNKDTSPGYYQVKLKKNGTAIAYRGLDVAVRLVDNANVTSVTIIHSITTTAADTFEVDFDLINNASAGSNVWRNALQPELSNVQLTVFTSKR